MESDSGKKFEETVVFIILDVDVGIFSFDGYSFDDLEVYDDIGTVYDVKDILMREVTWGGVSW